MEQQPLQRPQIPPPGTSALRKGKEIKCLGALAGSVVSGWDSSACGDKAGDGQGEQGSLGMLLAPGSCQLNQSHSQALGQPALKLLQISARGQLQQDFCPAMSRAPC